MSKKEIGGYLSKIGRKGAQISNARKTAEQRSAQARKASHSRRALQKPGPWFKVVLFPEKLEWRGVQHACGILDEMENRTAPVLWTQDRAEAKKAVREWAAKGREAEIFEQAGGVRVTPEFVPDAQACVKALRGLEALLKGRRK
jgi:hypothetical protein